MSDPTPPPTRSASSRPTPTRTGVLRATAWVATVGVIAALIGIGLLARPVQAPLQNCGSVYGFLRDGRVNVYGDPANPPVGSTKADVEANNAKPCRPRVANAALPSAVLIPMGIFVAVTALLVETVARFGVRRRSRRRPGVAPTGG